MQQPGLIEVDENGCPTVDQFYMALSSHTATAWGDYNNDGYADMFGPADVYTNDGDGTFTKTTPLEDMYMVSLGDWNNDGYLDVFGMADGNPKLWTNDGDETWTDDRSLFASATDPTTCHGSTWGDWNGEGYLDTYSTGWYAGVLTDVIYMSNDGLDFHRSWVAPVATHSKGVMACDFDEDADMDIYISNYWLGANWLWENDGFDGNAGYTNTAASHGINDGPGHTQGSTWADLIMMAISICSSTTSLTRTIPRFGSSVTMALRTGTSPISVNVV